MKGFELICKYLNLLSLNYFVFILFPDNAVLIWHYLDYDAAPDIFGEDPAPDDEDAPTQKENWSVWKVLRGHLQVRNEMLGFDGRTV